MVSSLYGIRRYPHARRASHEQLRTANGYYRYRWDYVQQHKVPLPDEYDRIYHDIEPFWAIDPAELAKSQTTLERQGVCRSLHDP